MIRRSCRCHVLKSSRPPARTTTQSSRRPWASSSSCACSAVRRCALRVEVAMKNHVEFLDVHEFVGLLERCNPGKEEEKTVSRWATMLLENGRKTFGALRTEVLDARLDKLAQHHPNFAEVIGWIEAELPFAKVAGHGLDFQRLLLVGPPGTG